MTITAIRRPALAVPRPARPLHPVLLALALAAPLALALSWGEVLRTWRTGDFINTDDATRAVQIRDWMAGQGWFDLSAHRLGLPAGLLSHWSRVVDVPVASLIRMFGLALPPEQAERAARIAFPLLMQGGIVAAMAYAARVLAGPEAAVRAGLLIVLAGIGAFQFGPGRIHHHAPQIVLLTLAAAATLDAMDAARAGRAALAGACAALSLAIGLENLPFFAALLLVLPASWALGGGSGRAMLWSSAALGLSAAALFAALVPPSRYGVTTVDSFSIMHLAAVEGGCALLAAAAALTGRLATRRARLLFLAAGAAALAAALAALFPEGLHGPFYDMEPLLHAFWLDEVMEVRPMLRLAREAPGTALVLMGPILAGTAAALIAAVRSRGLARARWIAVLALSAVGLAGTAWALRVAFSLQPLALLGGAWAVDLAWRGAARDGRLRSLWRPVALLCLFSSIAWAAVPWPGVIKGGGADDACLASSAFRPLSALGTGAVFAPIDAGPYILAHSDLSALAGPYHRDHAGLRAVIEGFLAPPAAARDAVRATGARFLLVCGDETDLEIEAAPGGLAAALARGEVPPWLEPLPLADTPVRAYAVH